MKARIYRPSRHTMQMGCAKNKHWILDYTPLGKGFVDPLMAWTGTKETQTQVRLRFSTRERAISYAEKHNIPYVIMSDQSSIQHPKSYADNFAYNRLS